MKYLRFALVSILFSLSYIMIRLIMIHFSAEFPISAIHGCDVFPQFPVLLLKYDKNETNIEQAKVVFYARVNDYKSRYSLKYTINDNQIDKVNDLLASQQYLERKGLAGESKVALIRKYNDRTQYLRVRARWRDGINTITGWYIATDGKIIPKYVQYHSKSENPDLYLSVLVANLLLWAIIMFVHSKYRQRIGCIRL